MKNGNYVAKLVEYCEANAETMKPGTFSVAQVLHDEWCQIFNGDSCNCDPDVRPEVTH
jgi:hypothetical protein